MGEIVVIGCDARKGGRKGGDVVEEKWVEGVPSLIAMHKHCDGGDEVKENGGVVMWMVGRYRTIGIFTLG